MRRALMPRVPHGRRVFAAGLLAAACGGAGPDADGSGPQPIADVPTMMTEVLEPAAETYWDAVGTIVDFDGVHEFRPESDEDWERVRHAAWVLAESGNLLMMDGRALDRSAWMAYSRDLVEVGRAAIAAAEAEDPEAVFDAGAEVYAACSACHASYATQTLRPNDVRSDSVAAAAAAGDTGE